MTRRAVLIAGVFCLMALGVAAWRLGAFGGGAPGPEPAETRAFPRPSEVRGVRIESPGGRLELTRVGAAWTMTVEGPGGGVRWPAEPEHVRAALRLLTEAVDTGTPREGQAAPTTDLSVRLEHEGGPTVVRFGPVLAGGACQMVVSGESEEPGRTPAARASTRELRDIFEPGAAQAWRAPRALPDAALGVARIELVTGTQRITLRQAGGAWSLIEPMALAAESDAAQRLASVLASIPVDRFSDELNEASAEGGFDAPSATIVIERDERVAEGEGVRTRVVRSELRVGRLADLSGSAALCLARAWSIEGGTETPLWGPAVVVVPTAELNRISPAPEAYVTRRSWAWPASEVRTLAIIVDADTAGTTRFERGPAGWRVPGTDGAATASPEDEAALGALLAMLCESRAPAVLPGAQGTGVLWSHRVQSTGLAGAALGEVRLGRTQGASPLLAVESSGVIRGYDIDPGLARWLGW